MNHPLVWDIRGRGLMIGIVLVADRGGRTPLTDVAPWLNGSLPRFLRRKHGVLLGVRNSAITITPPLVVTAGDVTNICNAVADAFAQLDPDSFQFPELN